MIKIVSFTRTKRVYIFIAFIIVMILGARAVLLHKPSQEITYIVKRENLVDTVQISGIYAIASQTDVNSSTDGVISKLFVNNGDKVKKGDPLFHVESSATADQQKAAYSNYLTAETALDADRAKLNTLQSLMFQANQVFIKDKGITNPDDTQKSDPKYIEENADWLASEANYKNQQGIIAKDQSALASALQSYNETRSVTVTAPTSGIVVNLLATVGDQVFQPSSTTVIQPVLMVANLGDKYIKADITESYATQITPGQKVSIVFDALKNTTLTGLVASINTVGENLHGFITYSARISVDNWDSKIKPNMTAIVTIETLRKDNIIDVPNSAIITKNEKKYVQKANGKNNDLIEVTTGTTGIAKTEITRGLTDGTIILANPEK